MVRKIIGLTLLIILLSVSGWADDGRPVLTPGSTDITTVGVIGTGTWEADIIEVPYGGTGAATFGDNTLLRGQGTDPLDPTDILIDDDDNIVMPNSAILDLNYIDFNLINGIPAAEGRLIWNEDEGTLNLGMKGGDVNQQIGLEQLIRGKNVTGSSTTNGRPARISGASGNNPEFSFVDANDPVAAESVGLFTEDINTNANGYVTTFGLVRDIDTSGTPVGEVWADAERLFVSNTLGELTNVLPIGTERKIFIGIVLRAHATEGVIWVNPINIFFIEELSGNSDGAGNPMISIDASVPEVTIGGLTNKLTVDENGNITFNTTQTVDGVDISVHAADVDAHHAEIHTILSHDTDTTGSELTALADNSVVDDLHRHSELVAPDGSPDPALSVDNDGDILAPTGGLTVGDGSTGGSFLTIDRSGNPHIVLKESGTIVGRIQGDDGFLQFTNHNGSIPHMVINIDTGDVGIGTTTPTIMFSVHEKAGFTSIGGTAVKLTNKTGANSVQGEIVEVSTGTANAVDTATTNAVDAFGVIYESGVTDGAEVWVIISGIAEVLADAGGYALHDRILTSSTAGRGTANNSPSLAAHFQEIGHALTSAASNSLGRVALHFL